MGARFLFLIKGTALVERYGVMMLAAVLKRAGHDARVLYAERRPPGEIIAFAKKYQPAALLYSAMTGEHQFLLRLNREIKKHYDAPTVFGGPHATFFPEMVGEEGVDAICLGEGEEAVVEFANALAAGRDWTATANFWVKRNGDVIKNPLRPLVSDLDALPFADREAAYADDRTLARHPTKIFFAMRGCVFRCTYCFNHQYNQMYRGLGKVCRTRSVDNLLAEMKAVKSRWPMEYMQLDDDTFLLHRREWLEEFAARLPVEVGVPFMCNVRVDLVNPTTARLLKRAGCHAVWMGVETGDPVLRREILERDHADEEIITAVRTLRAAGIRVATQNLCGLPVPDPVAADLQTLQLNIASRPDFAWSSIFYPYPRTALGDRARAEGYYAGGYDQVPETNKINSLLRWPDEKTKWQVENLHKFFGLVTELPFLLPLVKRLIKLKPNRLFTVIFFAWYGYCWKTRIEKIKLTPRTLWELGRSFVRYLSSVAEFRRREAKAAS